jgi:hypothetical protein
MIQPRWPGLTIVDHPLVSKGDDSARQKTRPSFFGERCMS